jgi:hypothetical protein
VEGWRGTLPLRAALVADENPARRRTVGAGRAFLDVVVVLRGGGFEGVGCVGALLEEILTEQTSHVLVRSPLPLLARAGNKRFIVWGARVRILSG